MLGYLTMLKELWKPYISNVNPLFSVNQQSPITNPQSPSTSFLGVELLVLWSFVTDFFNHQSPIFLSIQLEGTSDSSLAAGRVKVKGNFFQKCGKSSTNRSLKISGDCGLVIACSRLGVGFLLGHSLQYKNRKNSFFRRFLSIFYNMWRYSLM